MNPPTHPMLKFLKTSSPSGDRLPTILCPGCGHGQVLNYTLYAVDQIIQAGEAKRDQFVFVTGVGCAARLAAQYLAFDSIWSLHGRTPAVATGILMGNPELKVIIWAGDGDVAAIGGNHLIHACRRNIDLTIICMNNGLYGMTGGQVAPTTLPGKVTTTTPYRNVERAFDLCDLTRSAGATYVARWSTAHAHSCVRSIAKGIRKKGLAFIEILTQCPTHQRKRAPEIMNSFRETTVSRTQYEKDPEKYKDRILLGEFVDTEAPEWIASAQEIIRQQRGEVLHGR
jgi:2-oxoglutarate ferredoxin oxidoreductase subunit beta